MTLADQRKLAASIFRLLKVTEISFPIGRTNKGNLEIKFSQNNDDFDILLDSVPLPTASKINDENNITLKGLVEKYWFDGERLSEFRSDIQPGKVLTQEKLQAFHESMLGKNKGGRPKGSKNRKPVEDKVNG